MFLTPDQVAELTGVKAARDGVSRARRQSLALSRMGVPHYINEIDRVIVARALIEGSGKVLDTTPEPRLRPLALRRQGTPR